MRSVPPDLMRRLGSETTTLCHVWQLTRSDGLKLAFTDHDQDLPFGGQICRAASGWTEGASDQALAQMGQFTTSGALDDAAITALDIEAGRYDAARVECWIVDWSDPALAMRLWTGTFRSLRREGESFVADIAGPLSAFERVVGRTYGRLCDADLGDGRCGLVPPYAQSNCDKRWATCHTIFQNSLNYRGFPTIPGDDFLTAYPVSGEPLDGGRR